MYQYLIEIYEQWSADVTFDRRELTLLGYDLDKCHKVKVFNFKHDLPYVK
jgi:hypothetical protein